ncbi:hypothetical protein BKI52_44420 [marine bacterium AO1-C]|nr:hypothetical protein BKI52_44420 [marine bacterium AO1-C]
MGIQQITFGGNALTYQVSGSGSQTLVFIHGGGLDHQMWEAQAQYFNKHYRVVSYDLRGHGQSTHKNNEGLDMDDLLAILHTIGVENFTLIGCSLGSIIALDLALAYPQKVNKLALVSPGLVGFQERNHEYLEVLAEYIGYIEKQNTQQAKMILKKLTFYGPHRWQVNNLVTDFYVEQCLSQFLESGQFARIPQLKEFEPLKRISSIQCPLLLVYGKLDYGYIHENVEKIEMLVPQAETIELDQVAHLPNMEQPEEFNSVLAAFIA